MGKAEGVISEEIGEFKVQFNSPVYRFEQILASVQYSPAGVQAKVERNTKEEVSAEVSFSDAQLVLSLVSKVPGYPINTKSVLDWSKSPLSLRISLDAGNEDALLSIKTKVDGPTSGDIQMSSTLKGYEHLSLQWEVESSSETGSARVSYDVPKLGKKSLRSSWKKEGLAAMKAEAWLNNGKEERGFSFQYSLASAKSGDGKLGR
jgi:hypothetical protein